MLNKQIIVILLAIIDNIIAYSGCAFSQESVQYLLSTTERKYQNLGELFRGRNMQFSITGSTSTNFELQQPMHMIDQNELNFENEFLILKVRPRLSEQGKQWTNQFAFLAYTNNQYLIRYSKSSNIMNAPNFDQFLIVQDNANDVRCYDFDYINDKTFIVACLDNDKYKIITINTDSIQKVNTFDRNTPYQIVHSLILQLLRQDGHIYLLITFPAYSTQESYLVDNCQIDVFKLDPYYNPEYQQDLQIDKALLKQIYKNNYAILSLMDLYVNVDQQVIICDSKNSTITLKLNLNKWVNVRLHNPTNPSKFYRSFSMLEDDSLQTKIILLYDSDQFMITGDGYISGSYSLNFDYISAYPQVAISNQYIIILDEFVLRILGREKNNNELYKKRIPDLKGFILNPQINDLILIKENTVERYIISEGYLIIKPFDTLQLSTNSFNIVGIEETSECQLTINYMVYSNTDASIYPTNNGLQPLSETIFYPTIPPRSYFRFSSISGPNQQMSCITDSNFSSIQIIAEYLQKLIMNGYQQTQISNALFVQIPRNYNNMYFITQDSEYNTLFYFCKYDNLYQENNCQKIDELSEKLSHKLTADLFTISTYRTYLYNNTFSFANEDQLITTNQIINTIKYQRKRQCRGKIDQIFSLLNQIILIFYKNLKEIEIYSLDSENTYLIINEEMMKKLNYFNQWSPTQINSHYGFNPSIISIVNNNDVIIMRCILDCIILKVLTFEDILEMKSYLFSNGQLIIVQLQYTDQSILEYDLNDLYNIRFVKKFELYHYQLTYPLYVVKNENENYFYIAAYTPLLQQTVIMILQTDSLLREALLTIIKTHRYFENIQDLQFTVSGSHPKYIYLNNGISEVFYQQNNFLSVNVEVKQDFDPVFIHLAQINSTFSNIDLPLQLKYQQPVQFVYLQTDIHVNPDFEEGLKLKEVPEQLYYISNDWFQGQVQGYRLQCDGCEDFVSITQPMEITDSQDFGQLLFLDRCRLQEDIYAYLTNSSILFLDSNFNQAYATLFIDQSSKYQCSNLFCSPGNQQLFLSCLQKEYETFMILFMCYTSQGCQQVGKAKFLAGIYSVSSLIQINDNIVLLSQEWASESMITICRIEVGTQLSGWVLEMGTNITKKSVDSSFQVKSMVMSKYKPNGIDIYKIYLSESSNGILWIDLQYNQNKRLLEVKGFVQSLNIKTIIAQQNLYLNSNYQKVLITNKKRDVVEEGVTEFYLLLITTYDEQYGIRVQFKGLQLHKTQIYYLLHPFGGWGANSDSVTISNGYVIMLYESSYTAQYMLTSYKIPEEQQNKNLIDSPTLIFGGIIIDRDWKQDTKLSVFKLESGELAVHYNAYISQLEQAIIHKAGSIKIVNSTLFKESKIKLVAFNSFYENSVQIQLISDIHNNNINWKTVIIIASIILVIFILIVLLICMYYKRKNKVIEETQLLD